METALALIAERYRGLKPGNVSANILDALNNIRCADYQLQTGNTPVWHGTSKCPIQNLVEAGALIAAAINNLQKNE